MREEVGSQKRRKGLNRWWHASKYSLHGLWAAWHETAFRQEALAAIILIPAAWWLGTNWVERSLLIGATVAVLVVELLNTALESTVDRIGSEWHALAKRAKDMGSAAVLLTLLWCTATWADALFTRFVQH